MSSPWKHWVEYNIVVVRHVSSYWQEDTDDADIGAERQSISTIIFLNRDV